MFRVIGTVPSSQYRALGRRNRLDGFDARSSRCMRMMVREIQGHWPNSTPLHHVADPHQPGTPPPSSTRCASGSTRPLDAVYPVIFFDALRVKIRDESVVKNKAIYLALALDPDGNKDVLGLWIQQTEARSPG